MFKGNSLYNVRNVFRGRADRTNLKKDTRKVKRNKEGFVSLKLISSFKRVKNLTKDWRQVAEAIERKSVRLDVNDVKTKVRRLDALPEYDETTPSRTVVALHLPLERPTIEAVGGIFSVCGDIVLVRILRPGNPIPADIKPFANKHPEMTAKVCALVEFERTEFALKAVRELNDMAPKDEPKSESSEEEENKEENIGKDSPSNIPIESKGAHYQADSNIVEAPIRIPIIAGAGIRIPISDEAWFRIPVIVAFE